MDTQLKVVRVLWRDIVTSHGWQEDTKLDPASCETVGFLVGEDLDTLVVASTVGVDEDHKEYNSLCAIPRGCVRSVEFIA